MKSQILKDLKELTDAGILSGETADHIRQYYSQKIQLTPNRLLLAFAILGAILIGLGIILIVAHNWDQLSRPIKSVISFIPLLLGQFLCGYSILRKENSVIWKESSGVFLFFAIGAGIALISQIYNIPGNVATYILTWMLLILPMVYLLPSAMTSLLYITGVTYYGAEAGYWANPVIEPYLFWLLLLAIIPFYIRLVRESPQGNFTIFHHWLLPLAVLVNLGTWATSMEELMFVAYMSLLGSYYIIGSKPFLRQEKLRNNAYLVLGSLGTVIVLLIVSFNWFWRDLTNHDFSGVWEAPETWISLVLTAIAMALVFWQKKGKFYAGFKPQKLMFLLFVLTFITGLFSAIAALVITNLLVFIMGVYTMLAGAKQDHLGILNYGLLIITALVVCRFFDTNLSFVLRGLLFVLVGTGFFLANYYMIRYRKTHG